MPKQAKESTLLRQWMLLRLLSNSDQRASELKRRLAEEGFDVTIRTVQRDLASLSEIFSLEVNDKNPRDYGWRWSKGARLDVKEMSAHEALALNMAELHLASLLPAITMNALAPSFSLAKARLGQLQKHNLNNSKNWLNKIRVIQPAQSLVAPEVDEGVQQNIYHALMVERRILAVYQSIGSQEPKEYELNPLGLLVRGDVYYVVASAKEYSTIALYAFHRFKRAEVLSKKITIPEGFNIDDAIKNGLGDFGGAQENIQLKIRCNKELITYLRETPLSQDQLITTVDDQYILTASVNDTWQLMWWLMSKGSALEVCEPESLRLQIKHEYQQGLHQYL